ncbi:cyanophycin synthetase [Clostridium hydrogeniformans]|uniref:cyanophycin synthetase n=1 Tax=Clostridium hydrogeniformans TaxID=349933 RepID=UPI0004870F37|nr:cyanophycin synthetase [Clostridium hydrogeniformans]
MKIVSYRVFDGRNIYSHRKCIRLDVDLQGYRDIPTKDINNFNETIVKYLPHLKSHRCGIYEEGGFIKRLEEGTYLSHVCEHMILALHEKMGINVSFGKAREIEGDLYYIIFEYKYKQTALALAKIAIDFINSIKENRSFDLEDKLKGIEKVLYKEIVGPSTEAILKASKNKGIPYIDLYGSGIYQIGYGKYGKIIEATIVNDTKSTAVDIACDKYITKKILEGQCIPVAKGGIIKSSLEALIQAEAIGYPVVLKPRYGNHGRGVKLDIKNQEELINAFKDIKDEFKDIIIEKFHKGNDFRICMINGEMIAAALRLPPYVIGDGVSTIKELINNLNKDPRRGEDHEKPLTKVKIDGILIKVISGYGYDLESIPKYKERVFLRDNANISTGGVAIDVTDKVCRENIILFERIAKTIDLNVCGIDISGRDLSIPLNDQNGVVMEVNAAPGIRMHHYPYEGECRDVAGKIVDMMFKKGEENIPVVSITGTNGKTTTTRLISHTLQTMGYKVGMTTTSGIYINELCIDKGDDTGFESGRTVLMNKEVEVAVLETARGGLIRNGLCYNLADVGVLTNVSDDHLGIDGIDTIEDIAHVKSLVIEAVKDDGYSVINGDDPISVSLIEKAKGEVIIFSRHEDNPYLLENIRNGNYGVYVKNNSIYVEKKKRIFYIGDLNEIPMTLNGALIHNVENALAACSALVGLKVDYCTISKGLKSFQCDEEKNPGRFNMFQVNGGTVVLDYGHNLDGYKAVLTSLKKIPHNNIIGVIGVPGDRLDYQVKEVGKLCGDYLDYIYIKEDKDKRERKEGEIAKLLEDGIILSGSKRFETILKEDEALKIAMENMKEKDIIVVFFEEYEPLLNIVKNYRSKIKAINE